MQSDTPEFIAVYCTAVQQCSTVQQCNAVQCSSAVHPQGAQLQDRAGGRARCWSRGVHARLSQLGTARHCACVRERGSEGSDEGSEGEGEERVREGGGLECSV